MYQVSNNRAWRAITFSLIALLAGTSGASAQAIAVDAAAAAPSRAGDAVDRVYAARADAPIWLGGDGAAAAALLDVLAAAPSHALPVRRYDAAALTAQVAAAGASPAALAAADRALSEAFLAYAHDLSGGALDARRLPGVELIVQRPSREQGLAAAALAADAGPAALAAHLAGIAPRDPAYERLRAYFDAESALAATEADVPRIPPGPTLRAGERGPRVAALRTRLVALGDLAPDAGGDPAAFDDAVLAAVRAFQTRKGLAVDGAVGPMTLGALNAGAADRAAMAAVNLERMRWLNRPLGARHVLVNIPDYTVELRDGDDVLFSERVVVGKTATQTPEFSDEMSHIVLNPTWYVPRSIATEDILPKLQADPTYLAQRNMRLVRGDGGEIPADPSTHDFTAYTQASFPYAIRQRPDAGNALGRVKFIFPNNHAIYLHDTPQKNLFARQARAYSWGCVRVRDPLRLAELLLAPQQTDARAFIDRVLSAGRERYVHLDQPVPVHLVYRTLWIDAAGITHMRPDVYGRDRAVLQALRAAGVAIPEA